MPLGGLLLSSSAGWVPDPVVRADAVAADDPRKPYTTAVTRAGLAALSARADAYPFRIRAAVGL